MTYDVVFFTDTPSTDWFSRGYGAYRLSSEIRKHGYSALTVDFTSSLDFDTFKEIIDKSVNKDTLMVGFSVTWFPYRHKKIKNPRYVVGPKSLGLDSMIDFHPEQHSWYYDSLSYNFSQGDINQYIDYIKQVNSKCKVVVGGAKSNEYVFEPKIDNVFIGYSENMIIDYLNSISNRGQKRIFNKIINYDVKGQSGEFVFNQSTTNYVDTDCIRNNEILTFEFSRGCIFNCAFCSYPHRNQDTREYVKYKEVIYNELLDNYEKYGAYRYVITDDTFNDYTEKLILINEVIQTLPFKPEFWAYVRLDLISRHPEQAQLLKDIGVKEAYYGLETWNDKTAKDIKKGGSLKKKIEGMRIAKECWGDDVFIVSSIIIGLPNDTVESVNNSVEWYINEGHKYIDLFAYISLTLYHPDETWDYKFHSDIEDDLEKYRYTFKDPENEPFEWNRNDDGDITSKTQADNLMIECNKRVHSYWGVSKWEWKKVFDYDTERSKKSSTDLYYTHVKEYYWPMLLKKLSATV
jgi:radical SAM superfamily enzyme YgiQ (UPF0313 family)